MVVNRESRNVDSLWQVAYAPLLWAAHFLACYLTTAVYHAKAPSAERNPRLVFDWVLAYTIVALTGILVIGWRAYGRHRLDHQSLPHDSDTVEDRRRFLGYASYLLAWLSGVAVIFTAIVPWLVRVEP